MADTSTNQRFVKIRPANFSYKGVKQTYARILAFGTTVKGGLSPRSSATAKSKAHLPGVMMTDGPGAVDRAATLRDVTRRIAERLGRYVNHERVLVRFASLWLVVATLFTLAWVGSYYLLPQGLLRGGNPVASADYAGSVAGEFATLFAWNVGVTLVAIARIAG